MLGFLIVLLVIASYIVIGFTIHPMFQFVWGDDFGAFFAAFFWPVGIFVFLLWPFRRIVSVPLLWFISRVSKFLSYWGWKYYDIFEKKPEPVVSRYYHVGGKRSKYD